MRRTEFEAREVDLSLMGKRKEHTGYISHYENEELIDRHSFAESINCTECQSLPQATSD